VQQAYQALLGKTENTASGTPVNGLPRYDLRMVRFLHPEEIFASLFLGIVPDALMRHGSLTAEQLRFPHPINFYTEITMKELGNSAALNRNN